MATSNLGKYSDNSATAQATYPSSSFYDDLAWAAVWLFRATNDSTYLTARRPPSCTRAVPDPDAGRPALVA